MGFVGQYTVSQSGLQYLRARFYDPATGQFVSRDPLESQTREAYAYAQANPPNRVNPTGLCGISSVGSALESINPISEENCVFQGASSLIPESAAGPISSAAAGIGDDATLGLTNLIREALGINGVVEQCSDFYTGGKIAGALLELGIGFSPSVTATAGKFADDFATSFPNLASAIERNAQRAYEVSGPVQTYAHWIAHFFGR
jgi:RHS repeat-associated protein